ncbi:hypothetical protein IJM86_04820 [bacterium]|nr:hypothetical protein [bacterium]
MSFFSLTQAAEIEIISSTDSLIQKTEKAIQDGKISQKNMISLLQKLHEEEKKNLNWYLETENFQKAQEVLDEWSEFYQVTTYLYEKEMGTGKMITDTHGQKFQIQKYAPLDWVSVTWGNDDYFVFPNKNHFVEVQISPLFETGILYNDLTATQQHTTGIIPSYIYEEDAALIQNLHRKEGDQITRLDNSGTQLYYYFDLTGGDTKLQILSGETIDFKDLYHRKSYNPYYAAYSADMGYQYCKKVADFQGDQGKLKEYSVQECRDAATEKYYPEMHEDILAYVAYLHS